MRIQVSAWMIGLALCGCATLQESFDRVLNRDTTENRIQRGDYDDIKTEAKPASGVCVHAGKKAMPGTYDPTVAVQIVNQQTGDYRVTLFGCDELAAKGLLVVKSRASDTAPAELKLPEGYRTVKETELAGFFLRNQQPGGEQLAEWPRVAVTITSAPTWHLDRVSTNKGFAETESERQARAEHLQRTGEYKKPAFAMDKPGCWTFEAKVWNSAKASRDVKPFHFCNWKEPLHIDLSINRLAYEKWAKLNEGIFVTPDGPTTGARRTQGPIPPDTPVPFTRPYQNADFKASWTGSVIQMVTEATGIDYRYDDRRLWFVLESELEPKGT